MAKAGEKTYFGAIGKESAYSSLNKPFIGGDTGPLFAQIGTVATLLPGGPIRLLDLGVGTGWTSLFFARMGYDVTAQDISDEAIALAKKYQKSEYGKPVKFIASDYESMGYKNEFDCAVFFDSLHHAEDEVAALKSVYKAFKCGGKLVVSEPGKGHGSSAEALEAVEKFGVTEKDMPPKAIIKAAKQAGFKNFKVYPDLGLVHKSLYKPSFNKPSLNKLTKYSSLRLLLSTYLSLRKYGYQGIVVLTK